MVQSLKFRILLLRASIKFKLIDVKDKNKFIYLNKFVMEGPKKSEEIKIHGVVFKGTLPA